MTKQLPATVDIVMARTAQLRAALPAAIPTEKFQRVVVNTIQRDPQLMECTPASIIQACEKAASDGLILDGKEAALVVYNTKQGDKWVKTAQYIPMRTGLFKLAMNTGLIANWQINIVYRNEFEGGRFECEFGDEGFIRHSPILLGDRGEPVLAYSIVTFKDGTKSREIMRWDDILKIARSQKKNVDKETGELKGIWRDHTEEMAKKTVLRRHVKMLPFESDTRRAFEREDDLYTDDAGQSHAGEIETPTKPRGTAAARLNPAPVEDVDPDTGEVTPPAPPADAEDGDLV